MTDEKLLEILKSCIEQGDCFTTEVLDILIEYKNSGGLKDNAQKLVKQLSMNFANDEIFQDRAYDILDIITGWCSSNFIVWN